MAENLENKNYAYIDWTNLYKGVQEFGWKLDHKRFRVFLKDKYNIEKAYLFIGFVSKNAGLYRDLQNSGYVIVFKPTIPGENGEIKGNCDAELVLQAVSDFYEDRCNKIILVTGDGDFACMVNFFSAKSVNVNILSPHHKKCSVLLKQTAAKITYIEELREKLQYRDFQQGNNVHKKEKAPGRDDTRTGSSS